MGEVARCMNSTKHCRPMLIPTLSPDCVLRSWRDGDQATLVRHANNRKIWRNLSHVFPHPYLHAQAEQWLAMANSDERSVNLAITYRGELIDSVLYACTTGRPAAP